MYQKHIRLIFYPKEPFFSLIISCFLISFFSSAASRPWPHVPYPIPPFTLPDVPSPQPSLPDAHHPQPGVPKTGTPVKHPALKPPRCPSLGDIGLASQASPPGRHHRREGNTA